MNEYKGHTAAITVDGDKLTISRGKLSTHKEKEVVIPLAALAEVRLHPATGLKNGWLQLCVGQVTPELSTSEAVRDRSTVLFTKGQSGKFVELEQWLRGSMEHYRAHGVDPVSFLPVAPSPEGVAAADASIGQESKPDRRQAKAEKALRGAGRPDVLAAAGRMSWTLGGGRELRNLGQHLHDTEMVTAIVQGTYDGDEGIAVLTDTRLLFVFHGVTRSRVEDFPLNRISSVSSKTGLGTGSVIVHVSGNQAEISRVMKSDLKPFVDAIRAAVSAPLSPGYGPPPVAPQAPAPTAVQPPPPTAAAQQPPPPPVAAYAAAPAAAQPPPPPPAVPAEARAPAPDVFEQLDKLSKLHQAGVVTDEEFAAKKADLLARL